MTVLSEHDEMTVMMKFLESMLKDALRGNDISNKVIEQKRSSRG